MGILQAHKFKIAAGSGLVIGTGACIATPLLTSSTPNTLDNNADVPDVELQNDRAEPPPVPKVPEPNVLPPVEQSPKPNPQGQAVGNGVAEKLRTLKGKKKTLEDNVSQRITVYRGYAKGTQFMSQLEKDWKNCKSKNEVNLGITEEEKNSLKNSYQAVKKDAEEYEGIQKAIEGELKKKESVADGNEEDEGKYLAFEKEFNEVNNKYQQIEEKKSNEKLLKDYKTIYDKLDLANSHCSFKDLIKLNDQLAEKKQS